MIVDGQTEFVGNDLRKATAAIGEAAKAIKGRVEVLLTDGEVKISASGLPNHQKATVYLAVTEDAIASDVKGGGNDGSHLEHSSVGRKLMPVGTIESGQSMWDLAADIKIEAHWKPANLNYIVFIQEDKSGKIIAVGKAAK